jgi:hypothetical protein
MTATETPTTELSPRLQEFQREVDQLKVSGGKANPERAGVISGIVLQIVGTVVGLICYFLSHSTKNPLEQQDYQVLALFCLGLVVIGTGLFIVYSLTRYFRYWLVRLVYEQRESTDRLLGR